MRKLTVIALCVIPLITLAFWAPMLEAYPTYSQGKVINPAGEEESYGNCKTCHGNFRDPDYISLTDGKLWSEIYTEVTETEPVEERGLHNIHRHIMLDKLSRSRCNVCHLETGRYPVVLNSSASTDFEPISCVGCHGREEDSAVTAAGLRQHHTNARVKECMTCHADADPTNYTPVGENVLPPYYFTPDPEFPNKPTDPCNQLGEEDYAGIRRGLDNDGDGNYDMSDRDCKGSPR